MWYANDLVIVAATLDELKIKLQRWKEELQSKGLKVNVGKANILCSSPDALKSKIHSVKYPCDVCWKGISANSIICTSCNKWIHKRCSARHAHMECRQMMPKPDKISIGEDDFELVPLFCYLILGQSGRCVNAVTARIRSAWKRFRELMPILTNHGILLVNRGKVLNACVCSILLYGSESRPLSMMDLPRLKMSDHAMIRWIYGMKLPQPLPTEELRNKLNIYDIADVLRLFRLHFYGSRNLYRQDDTMWPKWIFGLEIEGANPCGCPRLQWKDTIKKISGKGINWSRLKNLAQDRKPWREISRVSSQSAHGGSSD